MKRNRQQKHILRLKKTGMVVLFFFIGCLFVKAQEVQSSINRDTIKIGEQITYKIEVEVDSASPVVFPQGQSFIPLEVVDTTAIDTLLNKNTLVFKKEYALTHFDSGAFTIPKQTIIINGQGFYTDSFRIEVNGVIVDTTKQKLYPVKQALDIATPFSIADWLWWILGGIIVLGILFFLLRKRKQIIAKKKELPPYEKAIQTLKTLDQSDDLESGQVKAYYSSLSEAVKRYVDEKIDDRALESTTDEFIALLRTYKKEKQLYLKAQVIDSLEAVLKRADLAKFAGIKTDKLTAREDRQMVENDINAFDQAIPEPTEEEKMQNAAYRKAQEKKQRRRKILIMSGIGVLVVFVVAAVFVGIKGLDYSKELVFSTPTEKMLKDEWITSEYGIFGMTVTTPKVLVRQMDSTAALFHEKTRAISRFSSGDINGNFYVQVTNMRFKKGAQIDSVKVGQLLDRELQGKTISNMTFKHQDFTTYQNETGQRVFGTFSIENAFTGASERKAYTFLVFNENGGLQELLICYNAGDEAGQEINERVVNSIKFDTQRDD